MCATSQPDVTLVARDIADGLLNVRNKVHLPFVANIEKQDMWLSPAVVLTVGAIMTFGSLLFSPETKDLGLHEVGERERAFEAARDFEPVGMSAD